MKKEVISLQSLSSNGDIQIGYSDNDIAIIDSFQKLAEVSAAHVEMNAVTICTRGKAMGTINGKTIEVHKNQVAIIPHDVMVTDLMIVTICTRGKAMGTINGKTIEVHKNQVAIIPHDVIVTDIMISPDFDMKVMLFTNRILHSFLHEKVNIWNDVVYIHRMHVITMEDDDLRFYTNLYEMLSLCFYKEEECFPFRTDVIQALLRGAILGLCGALKHRMLNDKESIVRGTGNNHFQRFLDLLHSLEVKHHSTKWYASELCITPKYLSFICKKNSGKTASEWITEHVMEDIRYNLKQTDYSNKQVCKGSFRYDTDAGEDGVRERKK